MNCRGFEDRLNLLLDTRRLPQHDELLQSHAQVCDVCRERLHAQESLFAGLDLRELPPLSPHFAQTIVAEVVLSGPSTPARSRPPRARLWLGWVALAAAALVAVTLAINRRGAGWQVDRKPALAGGSENRPVHGAPGERPGRLHQSRGSLYSAVNAGAMRADVVAPPPGKLGPADQATGLSHNDPLARYRDALHGLAMKLPDAVEQLETVEEFAPGIRPVRASFSVAIDALRKTLPGNRDERPGIPQAGLAEPLPEAMV